MSVVNTHGLRLTIFLVVLAWTSGGAAQGPNAAPSLATIKGLTCSFPLSVSANWDTTGDPQAQIKRSSPLMVQFDEIDTQEGTARLVGTAGSHATLSLSGWSLHIMDIRSTGSLGITTVYAQESRAGKLKAVHTESDYLRFNTPTFIAQPGVSQHYGECEAVR